jgi:hypothetical protein
MYGFVRQLVLNNNVFIIGRCRFILVCKRRPIVLRIPLQLGFPGRTKQISYLVPIFYLKRANREY